MTLEPEVISLLGKPLMGILATDDEVSKLEEDLATAAGELAADPDDVEKIIMYGRRQAYLWRYRDSIETFTRGIEQFPDNAMLYRHRGHRYITMRQFADADRDLTKSAELDQSDWNIWYHLGLARFLLKDYAGALKPLHECYKLSEDDELMTAILHWYYMNLRMLDREDEARALVEPFNPEKIEENTFYYNLVKLYQGNLNEDELLELCKAGAVDDATMGFGLGMWYFYNGNRDRAEQEFERVLQGPFWAAFGYIGAEAALAGMRK